MQELNLAVGPVDGYSSVAALIHGLALASFEAVILKLDVCSDDVGSEMLD